MRGHIWQDSVGLYPVISHLSLPHVHKLCHQELRTLPRNPLLKELIMRSQRTFSCQFKGQKKARPSVVHSLQNNKCQQKEESCRLRKPEEKDFRVATSFSPDYVRMPTWLHQGFLQRISEKEIQRGKRKSQFRSSNKWNPQVLRYGMLLDRIHICAHQSWKAETV